MPDREELLAALHELSDEDLREIVNEMLEDPRTRRRTGIKGLWYRYAGSIAFVLLILLTAFGFYVVQGIATDADNAATDAKHAAHDAKHAAAEADHFATQLRDGLVESCEKNGNPLRTAVIGVLRDQIQQSKSGDLEQFFPQIPPEQLKALIDKANAQRRDAIQKLHPVDCQSLYPMK